MDRELEPEELAYSIMPSRKIFSQIILAFVFPLSFIYLAQIKISDNPTGGWFSFFLFGLTSEFRPMKFIHYAWLSIDFGIGFFSLFRPWFAPLLVLIYTKKEIAFNKVTSVVSTVWKRLTITFLWPVKPFKGLDDINAHIIIGIIDNIIYTIGFSKALIKGNIWMASFIFITVQIFLMIVIATFHNLVIANGRIGVMGKVSLGIFFSQN
ncbi:hypothetical protein MKW92_040182, partial [Papaver armeniacum]